MLMDRVDLMDQMDKRGAPRDTPWVCGAAVWYGSGCRFTAGENKTNPAARLEESAAAPTGKSVRDF